MYFSKKNEFSPRIGPRFRILPPAEQGGAEERSRQQKTEKKTREKGCRKETRTGLKEGPLAGWSFGEETSLRRRGITEKEWKLRQVRGKQANLMRKTSAVFS